MGDERIWDRRVPEVTLYPEDFPASYHTLPAESQLRILDILDYTESLDLSPEQYRELGEWFKREAERMLES